jgi:hypothetical protein
MSQDLATHRLQPPELRPIMSKIALVVWGFATLAFLIWAILAQVAFDRKEKCNTSTCETKNYTSTVPTSPGLSVFSSTSMNVLTSNFKYDPASEWASWDQRKTSLLLSLQNDARADIYGFQELTKDQRDFLEIGLGKEYEWFGDYRVDDSESNPLVWRNALFEKLDGATVKFEHQDNTDPKAGSTIYQRIFTWAHLRMRMEPYREILAVCTHMYRPPQMVAQKAARVVLNAFLAGKTTDSNGRALPQLLMADWNPSDEYNVADDLVSNSNGTLHQTDPKQSGTNGTRVNHNTKGDGSTYMLYEHTPGATNISSGNKYDSFVASTQGLVELHSTIIRYLRVSEAQSGLHTFVANSDHDAIFTLWGI